MIYLNTKHVYKRLQLYKSFLTLKMSSTIECPICMDDINTNKNCITTECGHCFHASCVMRNIAQNGFACPMCRTAMAEYEDEEDSEYQEEFSLIVDERNPDDYALRGFRLFMDNVEGVAHDREDELEESEDMEEPVLPSSAYIAQKLQEQGATMEDLVKILLREYEEYDTHDEEFERVDDRIWGAMRILIDNYETQEVEAPLADLQSVAIEEPIHPNVTVRRAPVTPTVAPEPAENKPPSMRQRRPSLNPHLDSVSRVLFASDAMEE
jgi:hypothetical protein